MAQTAAVRPLPEIRDGMGVVATFVRSIGDPTLLRPAAAPEPSVREHKR